MNMLRAILVDDERPGRQRLRRMLQSETDVEIVAECGDGPTAVQAIIEHRPDLLFLDINMPGMDGFDVLDTVGPDAQPKGLIFVTAYDQHALRAFDACAIDYLLKPVSTERLARAVNRARERVQIADRADTEKATPASRFVVRSGNRVHFVAREEVDWVEAAGNYMILHVGAQNHMIRETMSGMESQLGEGNFLRVSRSSIVNLRRVKELQSGSASEPAVILHDGQRIHMTRPVREVADRLAALQA